MLQLSLSLLPGRLAVCRLEPSAAVPEWAWTGGVCGITRTQNELSIVCSESDAPADVRAERGWRALEVAGPIDFAQTGVLVTVLEPLADASISIFALSTFDTDYVLVREHDLRAALQALARAGCNVRSPDEI